MGAFRTVSVSERPTDSRGDAWDGMLSAGWVVTTHSKYFWFVFRNEISLVNTSFDNISNEDFAIFI